MGFNSFIKDLKNGVKRKLKSRKEGIEISPEELAHFGRKYFSAIKADENFRFTCEEEDLNHILFILRWWYHLWLEIDKNDIIIHANFPAEFIITREVNKSNHRHTPKVFKEGTIMYHLQNSGTCNWMNGIPLWDDPDEKYIYDLRPTCQINYDFIRPRVYL